jgi:hypothetical protein
MRHLEMYRQLWLHLCVWKKVPSSPKPVSTTPAASIEAWPCDAVEMLSRALLKGTSKAAEVVEARVRDPTGLLKTCKSGQHTRKYG